MLGIQDQASISVQVKIFLFKYQAGASYWNDIYKEAYFIIFASIMTNYNAIFIANLREKFSSKPEYEPRRLKITI